MPDTPTEILSKEAIDELLKQCAVPQRGEEREGETKDELIAALETVAHTSSLTKGTP